MTSSPVSRSLLEDVLARIDRKALVELTADLVNIPSPTGSEEEIAHFLFQRLKSSGMNPRLQLFEDNRYNVIAQLEGKGGGGVLLFNGHIDTSYSGQEDYLPPVPGYQPHAIVEDDWLIGMGSYNMKGALAAYIIAAEAVKQAGVPLKGDVLLALVGGEIERHPVGKYQGKDFRGGGCGTRYLVTNGGIADVAVIGEPTQLQLVTEHVGSVAARLTVTGLPAPLRRASAEIDAIKKARPLFDVFDAYVEEYARRHQYKGLPARIHMHSIEAGWPWRCNRTPVFCSLFVELRILPNQTLSEAREAILGLVEAARKEAPNLEVEVEFYVSNPGISIPGDSFIAERVRWAHQTVTGNPVREVVGPFYSDATHLVRYGIPAVNYGPSGRTKSGMPSYDPELGEHISIDDLYTCCQVYAAIILDVCMRDRAEVRSEAAQSSRNPVTA